MVIGATWLMLGLIAIGHFQRNDDRVDVKFEKLWTLKFVSNITNSPGVFNL